MGESDTPKLADECQKLLDNGQAILLFRSDMGSYTAVALPQVPQELLECIDTVEDRFITDDFLPSQALYRLTEKVTTGRIA